MRVLAKPQPITNFDPSAILRELSAQATVTIAGQSKLAVNALRERLSFIYSVCVVDLGHAHANLMTELPDVLVIDLTVDCAKALQLCYKIKLNEHINHIPLILVGEHVDVNLKLTGLQFGAEDCLLGEDYMAELVWRINNYLQLCKNLRNNLTRTTLPFKDGLAPSPECQLLVRLIKVVEDHLSDPKFSVTQFAQELAMSQIQLYRKVTLLTGLTPNDYIRKMRLQRAADLLTLHTGSITEIAYKVGFNNLSYFAKCFREQFACSPSDFVKNKKPLTSHLVVEKSVNMVAS